MNKGELEDFKIGKLSILLVRLGLKYSKNLSYGNPKQKIQ
jgi:hypothetical protein